MEQQRNTLSNVFSRDPSGTSERWRTERTLSPHAFKTFLNVYSQNLVYRFPNIDDLNTETIDRREIEKLAEFSIAVSVVAYEVWDRFTQTRGGTERERKIA